MRFTFTYRQGELRRALRTRMPGIIALIAIVIGTAGCDKLVVKAKLTAVGVTNNVGPEPVIFETPEVKEQSQLKDRGAKLLYAREFDEIEKIARELRASKAQWENGYWKLGSFYEGFSELPDEASERRWTNLLAHLRLWVKAKPESITASTALGRALTSYAWKARGSGWADTVTPTGWKLFHARLAEARQVLLTATNAAETCPLWFTGMLTLGLGEGWPRDVYDKMFSAGTNYLREYVPIYGAKCYYLLPRWYGREGEWERFASDVADAFGGEEGDILYARMVWAMHASGTFAHIFQESKASWPRAKRGFLLLQKRYPDSVLVTSVFCCLSGQAGDRPMMKALFAKLGGRVDLTIWLEKKNFVQDRKWAFAQ
jgi:hypothetical protein